MPEMNKMPASINPFDLAKLLGFIFDPQWTDCHSEWIIYHFGRLSIRYPSPTSIEKIEMDMNGKIIGDVRCPVPSS